MHPCGLVCRCEQQTSQLRVHREPGQRGPGSEANQGAAALFRTSRLLSWWRRLSPRGSWSAVGQPGRPACSFPSTQDPIPVRTSEASFSLRDPRVSPLPPSSASIFKGTEAGRGVPLGEKSPGLAIRPHLSLFPTYKMGGIPAAPSPCAAPRAQESWAAHEGCPLLPLRPPIQEVLPRPAPAPAPAEKPEVLKLSQFPGDAEKIFKKNSVRNQILKKTVLNPTEWQEMAEPNPNTGDPQLSALPRPPALPWGKSSQGWDGPTQLVLPCVPASQDHVPGVGTRS